MAETTSQKTPPRFALYAALAVFPLVCAAVGFASLPRPQTAQASRQKADRSTLKTVVSPTPFPMATALDAAFERIKVRGITFEKTTLKQGEELALDLFFEATSEMNRNWKVFLHIDRTGQSHRIHGDHFPASGRYPTTLWRVGDNVKDTWSTTIPANALVGTYEIWLGFYIGDERMKWTGGTTKRGGDHRVLVGTIEITPK